MSNSVGCVERSGSVAAEDGAAVARVRSAGAVPLLVSATPELCLGWETASLLHGRTNNPYHLACTPGGSSGGEPSEDLPLVLGVMAGDRGHLLNLHQPVDLSTIKVHYMTEASRSVALLPVEHSIRELIVRAATHLRDHCGATLTEKKFKALEDSVEMSISVFFSMKDIPNLLHDPANPKRDKSLLLELMKSAFGAASRSLQALGFALISRTRLFIPRARTQHYQDLARRLQQDIEVTTSSLAPSSHTLYITRFWNALMFVVALYHQSTLGSDGVLLYPAHCGPAHAHSLVFLRAAGVLYTMPLNVLALPATVVPVHDPRHTMPLALQVIAGPNQDRLCLAVARQLERAFGGWRPPR
ncbi:Fatty-acid amide hydrolase 2-B [Papilio xuthus]|uniref:Fatty-acid amide hydrolase 2-B n=1 Tax=Papilio xuthus TaxID=66420 RepID=A0A194QD01_PAPXU|nr:Fatty-acid amide hydrolase 2-B [Papilio xuthus]